MSQVCPDEIYMRRCLSLAVCGRDGARPNPMVGAVIVAGNRIIGEGYHIRCGEGHAEVNAFASVGEQDEPLLSSSTMYVSLEPCSHFGRTPPCADLIIRKGVKRVVVGCVDPFAKVSGKGIERLRKAGVEVVVGVLQKECLWLNRRFIVASTLHRPYIIIKWAQTDNGFIDNGGRVMRISTLATTILSHKLRSEVDAIIVGRVTDEREHPRLNVRHWAGRNPLRIVLSSAVPPLPGIGIDRPILPQLMVVLEQRGVQSVLVEGGAVTARSFIDAGLWDEIRIETSPDIVCEGTQAPKLPSQAVPIERKQYGDNVISTFARPGLPGL